MEVNLKRIKNLKEIITIITLNQYSKTKIFNNHYLLLKMYFQKLQSFKKRLIIKDIRFKTIKENCIKCN
jgi:hypothetical protein